MIWKIAISQFVKHKQPIPYSFVGTGLQKLGFINPKLTLFLVAFRASGEYVSRNVIFIGLV